MDEIEKKIKEYNELLNSDKEQSEAIKNAYSGVGQYLIENTFCSKSDLCNYIEKLLISQYEKSTTTPFKNGSEIS